MNEDQAHRWGGRRLLRLLASGFGVGRLPAAPGTAGSLLALPLWYLGGGWGITHFALLAAVLAVSVPAAQAGIEAAGQKDPSWVVIDEVAGMLFAATGIAWGWRAAVLLFVLFRIFDIFKFGPAAWLDARGGAVYVVADDLVAGLCANLSYRGILWVTGA